MNACLTEGRGEQKGEGDGGGDGNVSVSDTTKGNS